MRVSVLGPLEVTTQDGGVPIGGGRLRALVIRLAMDTGHPVTVDSLVDAVWPEQTPVNPGAALQSLVWRLRQVLPDEQVVRSGNGWYLLDVPPDAVDAHLFERLAADGRRALRAGDAVLARHRLRAALALWRGEALIDVADAPYAVASGARLRELRLTAVEDRTEADLAVEPAPQVMAELTELTAVYPLRERLSALLMRALDADGRSAEALAVYETIRRRLAEELGADPGPELRQTHLRVLHGDRPKRDRSRGNLRAPLTSFVGRAEDLARIETRLAEGRLVTLVGPGGVGKTRLATAFAERAVEEFDGGVWWVELASVTAPDDVTRAVLAALGRREVGTPEAGRDPLRRLVEALAPGRALLVLDNCEHVIEAAAHLVDEILARCPRLRVLVTSREPLRVAGERLCPVAPLPLPAPGAPVDGGVQDSVRLFADRAATVCPGFTLTADVAVEVAQVCQRLEGLPLAIELAAARLRTMTLGQLTTRLDDRFRVLAGGARSAPQRHRTLHAMVSWSWDLLPDAERAQAGRLSVFPSSFTAEAAERVGVAWETLDALVDKSLLSLDGERYRMLATIRDYGRERLTDSGHVDAVRSAHAAFFLELAERAAPHLYRSEQLTWLGVLAAERDNLLAALRFAADAGDAGTARRLGGALGLFWAIHDGHAGAADRLHTALTVRGTATAVTSEDVAAQDVAAQYLFHAVLAGGVPDVAAVAGLPEHAPDRPSTTLVTALLALIDNDLAAGRAAIDRYRPPPQPWKRGVLALVRAMVTGADGDVTTMRRDLAAAVAAFRDAGERWGLATALTYLGLAASMAEDIDTAASALDESITLIRELGGTDHFQRTWRAMTRARQGHPDDAEAELLAITTDGAPSVVEAIARLSLADLARYRGDLANAATQIELAAGHLGAGDFNDALLHLAQAHLALARGELSVARTRLREAFTLASSMPDMPMAAQVAVGVAELALRRGAAQDAALVLGAAHALRGVPDTGHPDVQRLDRGLHTTLDPSAYRTAYDGGCRLGRDDALATVASQLAG